MSTAESEQVPVQDPDQNASTRGPDPTLGGCALAFVGMAMLTLTPALGRFADIPRFGVNLLLGTGTILLFAGAAISIFWGRAGEKD